jgi:hypothetical protein
MHGTTIKITYLLVTYLLIYLLTYSKDQSSSWEANRFSASQEFPRILWNPKVHYCIHKCPPSVPILSQLDPNIGSYLLLKLAFRHMTKSQICFVNVFIIINILLEAEIKLIYIIRLIHYYEQSLIHHSIHKPVYLIPF